MEEVEGLKLDWDKVYAIISYKKIFRSTTNFIVCHDKNHLYEQKILLMFDDEVNQKSILIAGGEND